MRGARKEQGAAASPRMRPSRREARFIACHEKKLERKGRGGGARIHAGMRVSSCLSLPHPFYLYAGAAAFRWARIRSFSFVRSSVASLLPPPSSFLPPPSRPCQSQHLPFVSPAASLRSPLHSAPHVLFPLPPPLTAVSLLPLSLSLSLPLSLPLFSLLSFFLYLCVPYLFLLLLLAMLLLRLLALDAALFLNIALNSLKSINPSPSWSYLKGKKERERTGRHACVSENGGEGRGGGGKRACPRVCVRVHVCVCMCACACVRVRACARAVALC